MLPAEISDQSEKTAYSDNSDCINASEAEIVQIAKLIPDILKDSPKEKQKGNLLLIVEKGVLNLAKVLTDSGKEKSTFAECGIEEISEEQREHLPSTTVGLFVHYFAKGIKQDFGIEFDELPYSIRERKSKASTKVYPISLKRKNEIVDNMNKIKLLKKVDSGEITREDADLLHKKAINEYEEITAEGWIFPEKRIEHIYKAEWLQEDGKTIKRPFSGQGRGAKRKSK